MTKRNGRLRAVIHKLPTGISTAYYYDFLLKKEFWYGYNLRGLPIATSCCVKNGYLAIYTRGENGEWSRKWLGYKEAKALYPKLVSAIEETNPQFGEMM